MLHQIVKVKKMAKIPLKIGNIPDELKSLVQWVMWKYVQKKDNKKPDKMPFTTSEKRAKVNNLKTWTDYSKALTALKTGKFDGIGFVVTKDDPYTGVDFDECLDADGKIKPVINAYIKKLNSYTEITVSNKGLRTWVKSKLPIECTGKQQDNGKDKIEFYHDRRFFTMTGNMLEDYPAEIKERQPVIDELWKEIFSEKDAGSTAPKQDPQQPLPDMAEVEQAIDFIIKENNRTGLIYTNHNAWLQLMFGCASLGEGARSLAVKLTVENTHYDDTATDADNKFTQCLRAYGKHSGEPITWKTIFAVAHDNGWRAETKATESCDAQYHKTDSGNAERLVTQYRHIIRYNHSVGNWLIWNGTHWEEDCTDKIYEFARDVVKTMYGEALRLAVGSDERINRMKWPLQSENRSRLDSMVAIAQTIQEVSVTQQDCDKDPYLFNCLNCTLDLSRGQFKSREHAPQDCITKLAPVTYEPDADCPNWIAFLEKVFGEDTQLIDFIKRAVGYSLTGDVSEQCLFFCFGTGANGKTVFFKTLEMLFGGYSQKAPAEMLMYQGKFTPIPNDVARLPGARLVVASEIEEGKWFAESRIKDLTGGDTITARKLHKEYFEFYPTHKLWIYGNHKPNVKGTDYGIWRRIHIIPFTVTIPENERRPMNDLIQEFKDELSGILNWALEGYREYAEKGLGVPQTVKEATENYRSEMDVVNAFMEECIRFDPDSELSTSEIYEKFKKWAGDNNEHALTRRKLTEKLKEKGLVLKAGHARKKIFKDISFTDG
jgi:putative DNA primase/helicase